MLNHINLCGRLTRDVELRYTQSQKAVASFTIAVDRDGKDAGTDFIDIVAWNATANFVHDNFRKGSPIILSGRLQMRPWEDKNGNKRIAAEVIADRIYFVPRVKDAEPQFSDMQVVYDGTLPF